MSTRVRSCAASPDSNFQFEFSSFGNTPKLHAPKLSFYKGQYKSKVSSCCAGGAVIVDGEDDDVAVLDAGVLVNEIAPVEFGGGSAITDGGLGEEFVVVG